MTDMPEWEPACEDTKIAEAERLGEAIADAAVRLEVEWQAGYEQAQRDAQKEIVALRQVIDVLGANENTEVLIELAMEANDLMYANGRRDEAAKHHANQCCRICDTHVMPHRGCILR